MNKPVQHVPTVYLNAQDHPIIVTLEQNERNIWVWKLRMGPQVAAQSPNTRSVMLDLMRSAEQWAEQAAPGT